MTFAVPAGGTEAGIEEERGMAESAEHTHRVRIHYIETVRGEPRAFVYEEAVTASSTREARESGIAGFNWLAANSNSGWIREIERVEVRSLENLGTAAARPPLNEKPADY